MIVQENFPKKIKESSQEIVQDTLGRIFDVSAQDP